MLVWPCCDSIALQGHTYDPAATRSLTGSYNGLPHNPAAARPYKVIWDASAALLRLVALRGRRWEKERKKTKVGKTTMILILSVSVLSSILHL